MEQLLAVGDEEAMLVGYCGTVVVLVITFVVIAKRTTTEQAKK